MKGDDEKETEMKDSRLVVLSASVNVGPASRRKGSLEDMFDTSAELQKQ
jgi:hypothetical protein